MRAREPDGMVNLAHAERNVFGEGITGVRNQLNIGYLKAIVPRIATPSNLGLGQSQVDAREHFTQLD